MINLSPQKAIFIAIVLILSAISAYYIAFYIRILIKEIPLILETPLVFFDSAKMLIFPLFFGTIAYIIFYKFIKNKSSV